MKKIFFTVATCLLCFAQAQARTDFNINADSVRISTSGEYKIYGNGSATPNTITVDSGVVASIILETVNIDASNVPLPGGVPILISDAVVTLRLSGNSTLRSNIEQKFAIRVRGGTPITITSINGDGYRNDTLTVYGVIACQDGLPTCYQKGGTIVMRSNPYLGPYDPEDTNDPLYHPSSPRSASATSGVRDDVIEILPQFKVYVKDGWLYVNSPVEEHIFIYSISGTLLYKTDAIPANTETKVVELHSISASGSIVIVRGSSGWHKKIII
ncbi:MAG: hypothetical protein LBE71_05110 [Dysgonamonadaceae bacterium]|jgi:hypothetical protein|nr:hypothetical protein [Dysgonamonadaceae bacterium]